MRLQFGHGGCTVEDVASSEVNSTNCRLQFGHGGCTVEDRLFAITLDDPKELQFGHGGCTVEDRPPEPSPATACEWLQFGHGGCTVEDVSKGGRVAVAAPGFNSATVVAPWKTCDGCSVCEGQDRGFNSATVVAPWKTEIVV